MTRLLRAPVVLVLLLLVPAVATPVTAQAVPGALTAADYLNYETVADPALSPDGRQVVYTRRWINRMEDKWESALWIMDESGDRNRFFAEGSGAVWSPDGTRVAYLAEGEPGGNQIFVRWVDRQGPPTQVTREVHAPTSVRWSPDGRLIGFARLVPAPPAWTVDLPEAPEGAAWTPAPRLVDRLHYRSDRVGDLEPGETHLFVVPADGGTPRAITSGPWSVGARRDRRPDVVGWSWAPDGRTIVTDGYRGEDADLNYRDSHLYAVDVATGTVRQLTDAPGTWTSPVISPDGRSVVFTGHPRTRQTYRASDLYVTDLQGSAPRLLSAGLDRTPVDLAWAPDSRSVYFTAEDEGSSNLYQAQLSGGARPITNGTHVLRLGSVARTGVAAAVRSTFHKPPDIVRINLRRPTEIVQLTAVNDDLLAGKRLAEVEEVWYRSGATRVQGWLVRPPGFTPDRRYPLLLEIHGGPHSMYSVAFSPLFQWMAARGYVVLYTNPRGSTGYGTAFGNAIDLAYPSVDYDDLMAGVDTAIARGFIDEGRLYVAGCSGGGVLSSWVIAHTTRFAAAAVRCPVTNWISMAGQTDVPLFTHNFFERPFWEDPTAWLRQSTLFHVGKVRTPTLLMTGVRDLRTPISQTEEYFAALQMRGVPSAMLRFEGEWHGTTSKPSNFLRTVAYMDSWFRRHGQAGTAP